MINKFSILNRAQYFFLDGWQSYLVFQPLFGYFEFESGANIATYCKKMLNFQLDTSSYPELIHQYNRQKKKKKKIQRNLFKTKKYIFPYEVN